MSHVPQHDPPNAAKFAAPTPSLQNVVATFETGTELDLPMLALKCAFLQYAPKKFAAGVMRLREPRTTCLVFASGKAVCTGANTEQLACIAALKFVLLLQNNGIKEVAFLNFKVQNIVSASHCPFRLDLFKLAETVSGFCSYEPNLFPGLMYRVRVEQLPQSTPHEATRQGTEADHETFQTVSRPVSKRFKPNKPHETHGAVCNGPKQGSGKLLRHYTHPKQKKDFTPDVSTEPSRVNEVVFIVFQSGKCVITGGKTRLQILHVWRDFFTNVLLKYKAQVDPGSSGNYRLCNIASLHQEDHWQTQTLILSLSTMLPPLVEQVIVGEPGEDAIGVDPACADFSSAVMRAHIFQDVCELQGGSFKTYSNPAMTQFMERLPRLDAIPFERIVAPELASTAALSKFVANCRPFQSNHSTPFEPIKPVDAL